MTSPTDPSVPPLSPLPFATRFWIAWWCWWTVLSEGLFAAQVRQLRAPAAVPELPRAGVVETPVNHALAAGSVASALQLLALLQREGRFVDFVQQDIAPFSDTQIGQVARVVHSGCRKALRAHAAIEPVLRDPEAAPVEVPEGFDPAEIQLTGNVTGTGPFRGMLRHRGWKATQFALPTMLPGSDPHILAPAQVEL